MDAQDMYMVTIAKKLLENNTCTNILLINSVLIPK